MAVTAPAPGTAKIPRTAKIPGTAKVPETAKARRMTWMPGRARRPETRRAPKALSPRRAPKACLVDLQPAARPPDGRLAALPPAPIAPLWAPPPPCDAPPTSPSPFMRPLATAKIHETRLRTAGPSASSVPRPRLGWGGREGMQRRRGVPDPDHGHRADRDDQHEQDDRQPAQDQAGQGQAAAVLPGPP